MALGTIIGKVSVKVIPDTTEFRRSLKRQLDQIEADTTLTIKGVVKIDGTQAKAEAKKIAEELKAVVKDQEIKLRVNEQDQASVAAAVRRLEAELVKLGEIEFKVDPNEESIRAGLELFRERLKEISTVSISVDGTDDASLRAAIAKIDGELGKLREITLDVNLDEESLLASRANLKRALDEIEDVKLKLDRAAANKMQAQIDAMMRDITLPINLDPVDAARVKREVESIVDKIAHLRATITPEMDELARRRVIREIDDLQHKVNKITATVEPEVSEPKKLNAEAALAFLSRDRTVTLLPSVSKTAAARATATLAALSGGRLLGDTMKGFKDFLSNIDRAVPVIGSLAFAVAGLASGAATGVANLFALSSSLAAIGGVSVALPGIFAGIGVGLGITMLAFKNLKKALPDVYAQWQRVKNALTVDFWKGAASGIRALANTYLPHLGEAAKQVGTFWGQLGQSLSQILGPALGGMFDNLKRSIAIAGNNAGVFARLITHLGTYGARYLPRLSQWFVTITDRFDTFLSKADKSGELSRWVENGIEALKELWGVFKGLYNAFHALNDAFKEAGGTTLGTLADTLQKVADVLSQPVIKKGIVDLLKGMRGFLHDFFHAVGPGFKDFFVSLSHTAKTVLPEAGKALGSFFGAAFDALSKPAFMDGLKAMFDGLELGLKALEPLMKPLAAAFGAIGKLIGALAPVLGKVLTAGLTPLLNAFTELVPAVTPLITVLGDLVVQFLNGLAPVIKQAVPIIVQFLGNLTDALAQFGPAEVNAFVGLLSALANGFLQILQGIGPHLPQLASALAGWATALANLFTAVVPSVANAFVAAFVALADALAGLVSSPGFAQSVQLLAGSLTTFFTALAPMLPQIADAMVQLLGAVIALLPQMVDLVTQVLPLLPPLIQLLVDNLPAIVAGLSGMALAITAILAVFGPPVIDAITGSIQGLANGFFGLGVIIGTLWGVISDIFTGQWGTLWDDATVVARAWGTNLDKLFADIFGLHGIILGPIGDFADSCAHLLEQAGKDLITGLIGGIWSMVTSPVNGLKGVLNKITGLIPDWKGPASKDATLLHGAGRLIMGGLINGIESQTESLRTTLGRITDDIEGTQINAPSIGDMTASHKATLAMAGASTGATASGTSKTLIYHAAPGSSIDSEEDLFAAAERARMVF